MNFKEPIVVYTAANNLEAHEVVEILLSEGIDAYAVEDQSGVSLWAFGTISQFHQPNVFVDKPSAERAASIIVKFEEARRQRQQPISGATEIYSICEACGKSSAYPMSLNGTTQECPHCRGYVDVGDASWGEEAEAVEE
jgi:hypothetical protein